MRLAWYVAAVCLGGGIGIVPLPARAGLIVSIPDLFSTGVDDLDTVQANTLPESHFYIANPTDVPHVSDGNGGVVTLSSMKLRVFTQSFPGTEPSWSGNSTTSAWIGPDNADPLHEPVGLYRYTVNFNLTPDLDPSTASITAYVFGDDGISDVLLNATDTHMQNIVPGTQQSPYTVPFAFTFNAGFVAGLNTMVWEVNNSGGPSGLRVQFISRVEQSAFGGGGTGDPDAMPEPGSLALALSGVAALVWTRRRGAATRSHLEVA